MITHWSYQKYLRVVCKISSVINRTVIFISTLDASPYLLQIVFNCRIPPRRLLPTHAASIPTRPSFSGWSPYRSRGLMQRSWFASASAVFCQRNCAWRITKKPNAPYSYNCLSFFLACTSLLASSSKFDSLSSSFSYCCHAWTSLLSLY